MSLAMLLPDMPVRRGASCPQLDFALISVVVALFSLGLVMVASSSMPVADRLGLNTFYFAFRQCFYLLAGLALGLLVLRIRLAWWEQCSLFCILFAILLLTVVLLPGVGTEVNGSTRWLPMGPVNLQVSEPARLMILMFISSYVARRSRELAETLTAENAAVIRETLLSLLAGTRTRHG